MAKETAAANATNKTKRERKPRAKTQKDILIDNVKKLTDGQAEYLNDYIRETVGAAEVSGFVGKIETAIRTAFVG